MFFAALGHSEEVDTEYVLEDIQEQCEEALQGRDPKAGLLFAGIDAEHQELLDGIHRIWPGLPVIGCTTDGELSSTTGFQEDSITLMLFGGDSVEIGVGLGRNVSQDISAACRQAVLEAHGNSSLQPTLCIMTPESLTTSGQQIVTELGKELGDDVLLFGANAGDQWRFQSTYQFYMDEVTSDTVPVMVFSGTFQFSYGVASGWKPIGEPGCVSRSENNTVYEINDEPAVEFYRKYLGSDATPSGECPLAVLDKDNKVEYLRATPGTVDERTGAITYFADVREGAKVQITVADRDAILDGCHTSVEMALQSFPGKNTPQAAIIFSCSARKLLLGTRTKEEQKIFQDIAGQSIPMCGFYGYGEIGPAASGSGHSQFHNETFVTLLLGD